MEVRHKITKKTQTITKEDFEKLQVTGHAKNLEIVSETDYVPDELKLPESTSKPKEKAKDSAKTE